MSLLLSIGSTNYLLSIGGAKAVAVLQQSLVAETANRIAADAAEASQRSANDSAEGFARLAGDGALAQKIVLEATAREGADAAQLALIGAIQLNEGGGPLTPAQIGAFAVAFGAAKADLSNLPADTLARLVGVVTPELFGAVGDGVTDDTAALQAMADHLVSLMASTAMTPMAYLARKYLVSSTVFIRSSQHWRAGGAYNYVSDGEGPRLITSSATADLISIRTGASVRLEGLGFDASVNRTGGAFILVDGNTLEGGDEPYNEGSLFTGLNMNDAYDGLRIRAGINWTLRDSRVFKFNGHGVLLSGEGWTVASTGYTSNGDDSTGQSSIENCTIWDFDQKGTACARYACGGDFRIQNSKLLGAQYSVWLMLDGGARSTHVYTGTLIVSGNSMEQPRVNHVRLQQARSGDEFGNVVIGDNQYSQISDATTGYGFQSVLAVVAGTPSQALRWIRNISVVGGVVNGAGAPTQGRCVFDIEDGELIRIDGVTVDTLGLENVNGFAVGTAAQKVFIGNNPFNNLAGDCEKYLLLTSQVVVNDPQPMATGSLPSVVSDGSMMTAADGIAGSVPLLSGGTGAVVARQGGQWMSVGAAGFLTDESQPQLRFGDPQGNLKASIGTHTSFGDATQYDLQIRAEAGLDIIMGIAGLDQFKVPAGGGVTFVPRTAPGAPVEGQSYYDSGLHKLRTWDGSQWQSWW